MQNLIPNAYISHSAKWVLRELQCQLGNFSEIFIPFEVRLKNQPA